MRGTERIIYTYTYHLGLVLRIIFFFTLRAKYVY